MTMERETRTRLLLAAEELFAERGFAGVSVREIARLAAANTASVNYYFGTKQGLYEKVIQRHVEPINRERLKRLAALLAADRKPNPRNILAALIEPVLENLLDSDGEPNVRLMRLANRVLLDPEDVVQSMDRRVFGEVVQSFLPALRKSLPDLEEEVLRIRLFLVIGTLLGTLGQCGSGRGKKGSVLGTLSHHKIMESLLDFVVAGFLQNLRNGKGSA